MREEWGPASISEGRERDRWRRGGAAPRTTLERGERETPGYELSKFLPSSEMDQVAVFEVS